MIQQLTDIYLQSLEDALKSGCLPISLEKQETGKSIYKKAHKYTERCIPGEGRGDKRRGKVHKREHTRKRNISGYIRKGDNDKREQTHGKGAHSREDIRGEGLHSALSDRVSVPRSHKAKPPYRRQPRPH